MNELIQLLHDLVAIDSVNPDLSPGGAGESVLAHFIVDWCKQAGLNVITQEAAPGRPNVIVRVPGVGGGRSLMLNGHMDTVGVAGMIDPHRPYIEGNRLYGRGAYDMKGSLAACLITAKRAKMLRLAGDLLVTTVADEEVASIGAQAIVREMERWRPDAVIVSEPTELDMVVAHKGFVWLEIETVGRAAHGSRPQLGIDAIAKMGKVLVELEHLDLSLRANPTHPILQSGSLHASLIRGGQEWSSYPASCTLQVERRSLPGETPERVEAQVRALLDGLQTLDPTFQATVKTILARDPFAVAADEPIVQLVRRHATAISGREPALTGVPFWTDAALFASAGIPALLFGPHGAGAHAAVEWVDLTTVEQCAEIYLNIAAEFCGEST